MPFRDVPNESEQLNPFTKGPSRNPLAKGTCDGHFTEVISICDGVIVRHWSQTQFLEGHSSAQFSSNPNQTHLIQLRFSGLLEASKQVWVGAGWSSTLQSYGPPGIEFETTGLGDLTMHFKAKLGLISTLHTNVSRLIIIIYFFM